MSTKLAMKTICRAVSCRPQQGHHPWPELISMGGSLEPTWQYSCTSQVNFLKQIHIDGLMQEKCNSSALAVELRLSCTNPSIWTQTEFLLSIIALALIDDKLSLVWVLYMEWQTNSPMQIWILSEFLPYVIRRAGNQYGLNQWQMMLHYNIISHWLSPYPQWSLKEVLLMTSWHWFR